MSQKTFTTKEFEIALPETYIGIDLMHDRKTFRQNMKDVPDHRKSLYQNYFSQMFFSFAAADSRQCDGQDGLTTCTVNVVKTPSSFAKMPPKELLEKIYKQLNESTDLQESSLVELSGNQVARLVTVWRKVKSIFGVNLTAQSSREREQAKQEKSLTYIFIQDGKYVCVIYTTLPELFDHLLPMFEESFKTFRLL